MLSRSLPFVRIGCVDDDGVKAICMNFGVISCYDVGGVSSDLGLTQQTVVSAVM